MKNRIINSVLCVFVMTLAGCATDGGKIPSLPDAALVFIQNGKPVPVISSGELSTVSLAKGPFSLAVPEDAQTLRLCASHRIEVFEQLDQASIPCFAPGTGMAPGREEQAAGWVIRLGAEKNGHNYFDESRMTKQDGRQTVAAQGFGILSPEAAGKQTVYLIAFVDMNGDRRAQADEIGRFRVELDEPLEMPGNGRHGLEAMQEFSSAFGMIQSSYTEPVSLDTLVDHAIDGFFLEAGLERPARDRSSRPSPPGAPITAEQLNRLTGAFATVRERRPAIAQGRLWAAAIRQMAKGLDKFSAYLDAGEIRELQSARRGDGSIGLGITVQANRPVVAYVLPDSPAAAADIMPGDELVEIDGKRLEGMANGEVVSMLQGADGSAVRISTRRRGKLQRLDMARRKIPFPQVECRILEKQAVYLRPFGLAKGTAEALRRQESALGGTTLEPGTRVVLDLRGNSGGVLAVAVELADLFIEEGPIVELQSRDARDDMSFGAIAAGGIFTDSPVTVLVDGDTAAGAELIAAALQDHGRARIIGTPTAGLGSVQSIFPVGSGMLKLTTHQMKRPSGKLLSETGVVPDVQPEATAGDPAVSLLEEAPCPGSAAPPHTLPYDGTLRRALESH